MAIWQGRPKRKPSGGRLRAARKKRRFEIGREKQFTHLGPRKVKMYRVKGANSKARLLLVDTVNVVDPKTKAAVSIEGFVATYLDTHPHHRAAPAAGGGARGGQLLTTGTSFNPANAQAAAALARLEGDRSATAIADAFDALRAARAPRS